MLTARRWAEVSDEMRLLLSGAYGTPPRPFAPEALVHAAELPPLPEPDMDDLRSQAGGVGSEEDLLLLALFGEDAARLLEGLRGRGDSDTRQEASEGVQSDRIRELIRLVEGSDVDELTVEDGPLRITVRKHDERPLQVAPVVGIGSVPTAPAAEPEVSSAIRLESPMVGTFYRSPSPAQPAFVDEGDVVEVGQTLCILEAMKLFNEYKSDHAGIIRRILVENAQPVEYGQPLFELEPVELLRRVLIANRGEAAVRIVRACHDLGIEAVAVYSTADREGLWVSLADRAVCIGPHPPAQSYLSVQNLVAAAETTGCDAVHPGWGFLAESAAFVRACIDNDLVFVGPSPEALEVMGDKSRARNSMQAAGVPLVPGSTDRLRGADHARSVAAELGYPVLLKAVSGGGGRGMRLVEDPSDIEDAYGLAASEAAAAFGDGGMYVEKALLRPRHVEMQVLADGAGGVLVLGERDCSVQRRHQKLIEEGPSPALDAATRRRWPRRPGGVHADAATATPARSSSCSTATAASTSWR